MELVVHNVTWLVQGRVLSDFRVFDSDENWYPIASKWFGVDLGHHYLGTDLGPWGNDFVGDNADMVWNW